MYKNQIHTETFRDYTNTKLIKIHSIVLEIKHVGRWKQCSHKAETSAIWLHTIWQRGTDLFSLLNT